MSSTYSIQVVEIGDNTDPNLEYGTYRGLAVEVNGTFEAKVASLDEAREWISRNFWPVELKATHSADYVRAWDAVDVDRVVPVGAGPTCGPTVRDTPLGVHRGHSG